MPKYVTEMGIEFDELVEGEAAQVTVQGETLSVAIRADVEDLEGDEVRVMFKIVSGLTASHLRDLLEDVLGPLSELAAQEEAEEEAEELEEVQEVIDLFHAFSTVESPKTYRASRRDELIQETAEKLQAIYDSRTAGDRTFAGVLAEFAHEVS